MLPTVLQPVIKLKIYIIPGIISIKKVNAL